MKYQRKSASAYIIRNFWQLVYVALPVCILMAFFANPTKEIDFLHTLVDGRLTFDNLPVLFNGAYTVLRFGKFWWVNVITFVLLALTVAMLFVKIGRHMRVGVMPVLPFKKAFGLFPTTFLLLLAYFSVSEIAMLLSVGVTYILRAVNNVVAVSVVGVSVAFVVRLLTAWIFMLLILAVPLKHSENYHLNVGMSYSVRVMTKLSKQVLLIAAVYAVGRYVVMLCAYFLRPYYLDYVLYVLCFLFATLFLTAYSYKIFYDVVGGERRDLAQSIFD